MITKYDYIARALGRLTTQFNWSDKLRKLVTAAAGEMQEVEDARHALMFERILANAAGAQLDQWGKLLGEPRLGRDDAEYLRYLDAAMLRNTSDGTPNRMLDIIARIANSTDVAIRTLQPSTYEIDYPGKLDQPQYVRSFLQRSAPAGTLVWPVQQLGDTPFMIGGLADASGSSMVSFGNAGDELTEIV